MATVRREMQTNLPASLTMSMLQTWLRPPRCTGRAVPVTNPERAGTHVVGVDLLAHALVLARMSMHMPAPMLPTVSASATEAPPCSNP